MLRRITDSEGMDGFHSRRCSKRKNNFLMITIGFDISAVSPSFFGGARGSHLEPSFAQLVTRLLGEVEARNWFIGGE